MHSSSKVKESPQYGAISKYLAGEESLDSALDTFCAGVEAKFKDTQNAEDVEEMLWQAWRATVTMAASIPHASDSRQKLVDFVLELQKRPTLSKDDQACIVQDGTVWKDLPAFGMEMREAWNLVATNESSAEQQDKWINLNAWTATLVATVHARDLTSPDFSLYCIWVVRVALEEEGPANVSMEAAGMWFLYASPTIYQLCLADETFDGKIAKPGSLFKDREWRGFSQSRWATWLQQMEKAGQASSEDKIAKVAADAVAAMKAAER